VRANDRHARSQRDGDASPAEPGRPPVPRARDVRHGAQRGTVGDPRVPFARGRGVRPRPGALAVTVSDGLRVRSLPAVDGASANFQPLLPVGTQLEVLEGPVDGSGYTWIHVAPVGVTLDGGVTDGWVAIADHDGTPGVEAQAAPLAGLSVGRRR